MQFILQKCMLWCPNGARIPLDPPVYRTLAVACKDWNSLPIASKYFIDYLMEHRAELP